MQNIAIIEESLQVYIVQIVLIIISTFALNNFDSIMALISN